MLITVKTFVSSCSWQYHTMSIEEITQKIPQDIIERGHKQIGYKPEQLELDVVLLREWLKTQEHLPPSRLHEKDSFLKMYLTGCKGSLETVKRKLDCYYSYRGRSDIYRSRDVLSKEYRNSCDANHVVILPQITKTGEYVFISKLVSLDLKEYDPVNICKRMVNITELGYRMKDFNAPTYVVFDWENFTAAHSIALSPSIARDTLILLQDVFPSRIKMIIFFNVHPVIEVMVNTLIKPFLTKKVRERTLITSEGADVVHKYVDPSILPSDFGGHARSIKEYNDLWNQYEISKSDWFVNELSEETDESKRIDLNNDKIIDHDSYFGVQGSLKKLVID